MHLTADGPPQADCTPLKSAHNLPRLLRFFIDVRLALSCDLLFFKMAYRLTGAPRKIKAARNRPGRSRTMNFVVIGGDSETS
jgi:hypothetical protein